MLQILGVFPDGGYVVHLHGSDDYDPEASCDDWNALVAEVDALPEFATVREAVSAAYRINMHGYTRRVDTSYVTC